MKQKFNTLEQANTFIDKVNTLLCLPSESNGTITYSVPEPVEVKDENGNVVETYYEVPITSELNDILVGIATEKLLVDETVAQ